MTGPRPWKYHSLSRRASPKEKANGSWIFNFVLAVQEPEILTQVVHKLMDRVKDAEGEVASLADYFDRGKVGHCFFNSFIN
jgi:hypothetical protein